MNCCCQVVGETSGATGESQDRHNKRPLPASDRHDDNKVDVGNCYCINLVSWKQDVRTIGTA